MISTTGEYEKAQDELRSLEQRLSRMQKEHPVGEKGFAKAGVRKMNARLNEELAVIEGSEEAKRGRPV